MQQFQKNLFCQNSAAETVAERCNRRLVPDADTERWRENASTGPVEFRNGKGKHSRGCEFQRKIAICFIATELVLTSRVRVFSSGLRRFMRTKQLTIQQAAAVKRCIAATFKLAQNQDRFRDKVRPDCAAASQGTGMPFVAACEGLRRMTFTERRLAADLTFNVSMFPNRRKESGEV